MTAWLDKLNLQPQERRLVLAGIVIVALLLNYWFILPYFRDWTPVNTNMVKAQQQISVFSGEIGKRATYERQLKDLQASAPGILPAEQANLVQGKIQSQAIASGVVINNLTPVNRGRNVSSLTNEFFDEVVTQVDIVAGEKELVDFLYSLGEGQSNIRVREIVNLRLDPSQTRLQARLTLVASFQKKASVPSSTGGATNRPAGSPLVKPAGPSTIRPGTNVTSQSPRPKPGTNRPLARPMR